RSIRACIYRANGTNLAPTQVYYREDSFQLERGRFVLASAELPHPQTQPYIHDSIVKVVHYGKQYKFQVFFKRHKLLPTNQAILQLAGALMDGDILVVACGTKAVKRFISSLTRILSRIFNTAIRFAQHIAPFRTRRTFPASVSL
ncbi:hypothetical protein EV359DRAFT_50514, partial [Lentinula novae-zelandiae]